MRKLLFLLPAIFLLSCHHRPNGLTFASLNRIALFDEDSVQYFLANTPEAQADSSKKLFLSAVDFFKNKKKPFAAIELFLHSLSIYPTALSYYELGNAYLENQKFRPALQSFQMAEKLGYSPLGNVLFKQACCYAEMDSMQAFDYVSYAVENGFVNRARIFNSIHFAKYKDDYRLLSAYNEAMAGNGDPDEILWQGYTRDFKQASFPLAIDSGYFLKMGEPQYISYDYETYIPEMRDGKFSRDVGNEFFYVNKLAATDQFTAVVYGCQSYEENGAPVYYFLACFDPKGKLLDKKVIAGAKTFAEPYKEVTIQNNLQFEIQEYKNEWEKDIEKEGFEDNKIISRQLTGTQKYVINANGKIISLQQS
jgi:hypothetical protein